MHGLQETDEHKKTVVLKLDKTTLHNHLNTSIKLDVNKC